MKSMIAEEPLQTTKKIAEGTIFSILLSISFSHLLNDTIQSLILSIYPIVKTSFHLGFALVGLITLTFQVGGNAGSALGPLLAALVIVPYGQSNIIWFSLIALLAIIVLITVGRWYKENKHRIKGKSHAMDMENRPALSQRKITLSILVLLVLIFSKYFYLASISSYYTFFLIDKFHVSVQSSQLHLFIFLFSTAAGTLIGGPLGDRFGRKYVIWFSILGVAPFTLLLPYANLFWTSILTVFIGFILSSAFSAILVYAQELVPGKVGMIAGLFFGLAFGMGGIGAAVLGKLADHTSIS